MELGDCLSSVEMWLKKPNPGLTRNLLIYCLRFAVGLITGHCPLNKYLHNMGLIDEPICIACGMEDESAFHLLIDCSSLISLRIRTFSKPSALLRLALESGRFTVTC
jgi:hypothetical protein